MNFILILLFFAASLCFAGEPERIIVLRDTNLNPVRQLLAEGWTVKHQSASIGVHSDSYTPERFLIIFTLTPPPAEVLEATKAKKAAEAKATFERRRAEYLAKQPKVEKE